MKYDNDLKLRHLQVICARNLFIGYKDSENETDNGRCHESNHTRKLQLTNVIEDPMYHLHQHDEKLPQDVEGLLQLNNRMLVDSFIAVYGIFKKSPQLLYLSEIVENNKNPTYSPLDLPLVPLKLANSSKIIVKIWCKPRLNTKVLPKKWYLLTIKSINLQKLTYIGTSLINLEDNFHENSIVIKLNNRYYTHEKYLKTPIDLPIYIKKNPIKSYNFDNIRSLTNLSKSLNELIVSKRKLNHQIIKEKPRAESENNLTLVEGYKEQQLKTIEQLESSIMNYQMNINRINQFIKLNTNQDLNQQNLQFIRYQLDPIQEALDQYVYPLIIEELQTIIKVINQAFEIENINNSIQFSINTIPFPATIKELLSICYLSTTVEPIDQINAGLSYIVQLILLLHEITNNFVNYSIKLIDNQWYIIDKISNSNQSMYPLFYDDSTTEKIGNNHCPQFLNQPFEKGLTLLSKNITILIENITSLYHIYCKNNVTYLENYQSIPSDSSDNLLWNLKYLLLFITARNQ